MIIITVLTVTIIFAFFLLKTVHYFYTTFLFFITNVGHVLNKSLNSPANAEAFLEPSQTSAKQL